MKKPILIVIVVCIVLVVILTIVNFVLLTKHSQTTVDNTPSTSFPVSGNTTTNTTTSGSSSGVIVLTGQNQSSVAVADFEHNGVTIPDPSEPGHYLLAGQSGVCPNGMCLQAASTSDYYITYDPSDQSFNVLLWAEPLGGVRDEAQAFLIKTLGITTSQLCTLHATVGTIISVNSQYAGEELGFKGCPNAVQLPE